MKVEKIDYNIVSALSFKDLAYINLDSFLEPYYAFQPTLEGFAEAIEQRKKKKVDRDLLTEVLIENYSQSKLSDAQSKNLLTLKSKNTFTIITAHQPSLFGGPLYYVLKVASVINLCKQLKVRYPDYNFVPTFVSGGEDHDFEEVDHLNLYGKSVKWEREASGPVGRLDTTNLQKAINEVSDILGDNPWANELKQILNHSISEAKTYGEFVFDFVNALFGKYGVLVLNMDNHLLKKNFSEIMKREIIEQVSKPHVIQTQAKLEEHKFKAQAFPREINLFYLGDGHRHRIESADDIFTVVDGNRSFTKDELLEELENRPENFSPNVVMRPVYQEFTLPNLAYVGGGGEIAYWLERKSQFEAYDVFFPMLIRRNSAMIVNKGLMKSIRKVGFDTTKIFDNTDQLISDFISDNTDIEVSLSEQKNGLENIYQAIAEKSKAVDPSLAKSVLAGMTKQLKSLDQMESRIKRTLKSQQEVNINKIRKIKETLFPNNGLQERFDNFMPHYMTVGDGFFDMLIENLDPMDRRFTIFASE